MDWPNLDSRRPKVIMAALLGIGETLLADVSIILGLTCSLLQVRVAWGHHCDHPAAAFPVVLSKLGIPFDFGKI